jgi:hypothetical protein
MRKYFLKVYLFILAVMVLTIPSLLQLTGKNNINYLKLTIILLSMGLFIDFFLNKENYSLKKINLYKVIFFIIFFIIFLYQFKSLLFNQ